MAAYRAGNIAEIGFVIFVERSGHADDDDVHLGNQGVIRRGIEAILPCGLNLRGGDANDVRFAAIQRVDFVGIDVEAGDCEALLAEQQGKRQADVTHANNADPRLASFDFTLGFLNLFGRVRVHCAPPALTVTGLAIVRYHATVRSRPSLNCTSGSYPKHCRASSMPASECLTSPPRSGT